MTPELIDPQKDKRPSADTESCVEDPLLVPIMLNSAVEPRVNVPAKHAGLPTIPSEEDLLKQIASLHIDDALMAARLARRRTSVDEELCLGTVSRNATISRPVPKKEASWGFVDAPSASCNDDPIDDQ